MRSLRQGVTSKMTRLDRPTRSVPHPVTPGAELREHDIRLHNIEQGAACAPWKGGRRPGSRPHRRSSSQNSTMAHQPKKTAVTQP
jgi:hypothetical protein